ncbi:MAG: hypothetical protein IKY36_05330 [Bacteroidales bacterium]|nr:hypothetical protein [Bacteroidales bacterium]
MRKTCVAGGWAGILMLESLVGGYWRQYGAGKCIP